MFHNRQVTKLVSRKAKTFHVKGKRRENNNIIHSTSKCLCTKSVNSLKWKCEKPSRIPQDLWLVLVVQFSSVQSLSHVRLFATPWTAAHPASLSITNSCPLNQWCHPTISSSVVPFSSYLQSSVLVVINVISLKGLQGIRHGCLEWATNRDDLGQHVMILWSCTVLKIVETRGSPSRSKE